MVTPAKASMAAATQKGLTRSHDERLARPRIRVFRTFEELEKIRPIWTEWARNLDADVDVFETVLRCGVDNPTPHVILVERNGQPDAMWLAAASATTLKVRIGYVTVPIPRVRVLSSVYGGFLGNQSADNSELTSSMSFDKLCATARWMSRS